MEAAGMQRFRCLAAKKKKKKINKRTGRSNAARVSRGTEAGEFKGLTVKEPKVGWDAG